MFDIPSLNLSLTLIAKVASTSLITFLGRKVAPSCLDLIDVCYLQILETTAAVEDQIDMIILDIPCKFPVVTQKDLEKGLAPLLTVCGLRLSWVEFNVKPEI